MLERERYGARVPNQREQRLIALVAQGLKNHEVATILGTTEHVVKNYLRAIYDKLGLWNRVELALWHEARQHFGDLDPSAQKMASPASPQLGIKPTKWKQSTIVPRPGEDKRSAN